MTELVSLARNQSKQIIFLFLPVDEDWFLSKLWKNLLNTLIFILDLTIGQLHNDVIFFYYNYQNP